MSSRPITAVDYWFTTAEWGKDIRTGAFVTVRERVRRESDRPGKNETVWDWTVSCQGKMSLGTAQNQSGARRQARILIRSLPDKAG